MKLNNEFTVDEVYEMIKAGNLTKEGFWALIRYHTFSEIHKAYREGYNDAIDDAEQEYNVHAF